MILRVYEPSELGRDGYPAAWRRCPECFGDGWIPYGLARLDAKLAALATLEPARKEET